jgi:hypothetical protein
MKNKITKKMILSIIGDGKEEPKSPIHEPWVPVRDVACACFTNAIFNLPPNKRKSKIKYWIKKIKSDGHTETLGVKKLLKTLNDLLKNKDLLTINVE